MKPSLPLVFCLFLAVSASGQCLTDFTKLLPEPATDYTQTYGTTFSIHGNYLAIGLPAHDSLGRITGLVYIFERFGAGWEKVATLVPSDPVDGLQFGTNVKLSSTYALVTASGYHGGKVYMYKMAPTGWETQAEFTSFTYASTRNFGVASNTGSTEPVAISEDERTIAIVDAWYDPDPNDEFFAGVFVYHKQPHETWSGAMTPTILMAPDAGVMDFGRPGVAIYGDRVITGTPYHSTGVGMMYIYRDASGQFSNFSIEARLSGKPWPEVFAFGHFKFACTDDGIFTSMGAMINGSMRNIVGFFERPASGEWADMVGPTCTFPPGNYDEIKGMPSVSAFGGELIASYQASDGQGYSTIIRKGLSGWCDPVYEDIDVYTPPPGQLTNRYGLLNAAGSGHAVVGVLPHPDHSAANVAIKVLSPNGTTGAWESHLLYPARKTTAAHYYGRTILGFEDFLFVGAPFDGTVKLNAGAVYSYRKRDGNWEKTGKILAPVTHANNRAFGTALATNGNEIAVGATGFGDHGRVFIYRKKQSDWSEVELAQEIALPENVLTVFSYGDNLAMNDEWLVIPYVQNSPARVILAIYRKDGSEWQYSQIVEAGNASIFAKFTTQGVAIDGETMVTGNTILELNQEGIWQSRYTLSPSDPESARISSDFSHWLSNGSMFGHAVAISNNSIFISAPMKDHGTTWDVGAIYVYTKKPWESWSSRTETAKIMPRVKDEREMFGHSLRVLGNTLIAGAPGADYSVNGAARLKPGRAYVFQTEDYFWQRITPLMDFTGDSFAKDYFGVAVGLDETHFSISAPIEDIETGALSGSVYVTPAPPIVRLVPPVCNTNATIDLFAYPFGGTWSGPGLIDAAAGIFDPKAAGTGEHVFYYTTESCTYQGKLRIAVEQPIDVALVTKADHLVCEEMASINIPLGVKAHSGYQYLWYYRADPAEPFFPLNAKQPNITALYRGEYMAKVFNSVCASFSEVITIRNEAQPLTLDPVGRICQDAAAGIALSASPAGGTWSGPGVQGSRLYSRGISDGTIIIEYTYRSPLTCRYYDKMSIELRRIPVPDIKRLSGDLCREGEVSIGTNATANETVTYTWQHEAEGAEGFSNVSVYEPRILVDERGIYRLQVKDSTCAVLSNTVAVEEYTFPLEITPADAVVTSCNGLPQPLTVNFNAGATYQWYYSQTGQDEGTPLATGSTEYLADVSGYYYAVAQSGKCVATTPHKQVVIKGEDEMWLSNYVTPNGDTKNESLEATTNTEILGVQIVNRYGKVIFSGAKPSDWNLSYVTPGVYYSVVTYRTCEGAVEQVKSVVHVMR